MKDKLYTWNDVSIYLAVMGLMVLILALFQPIVAFVMALLVGYLVYYTYRKIEEKNRELAKYTEGLSHTFDSAAKHAILFPVNNSAPAITTNIRPTEKTAPKRNCPPDVPAASIDPILVARLAPKPIYTPARIPRTIIFISGNSVFALPALHTAADISAGVIKFIFPFTLLQKYNIITP